MNLMLPRPIMSLSPLTIVSSRTSLPPHHQQARRSASHSKQMTNAIELNSHLHPHVHKHSLLCRRLHQPTSSRQSTCLNPAISLSTAALRSPHGCLTSQTLRHSPPSAFLAPTTAPATTKPFPPSAVRQYLPYCNSKMVSVSSTSDSSPNLQ